MDQLQPAPLYQEIAEAIRMRLAAGDYQPGDKLPPVRHLARAWGCTPGTVSRAYRILAREGLVRARPGLGTIVAPHPIHTSGPIPSWPHLVQRAERFLFEAHEAGHAPEEVETALAVATQRIEDLLSRAPPQVRRSPPAGHLRFVGSHDLLLEVIARTMREAGADVVLDLQFAGSLGGLFALARLEADLAGVHLWDQKTGEYNRPFIERVLPGQPMILLTLAHRQLGLILAANNPRNIQSLEDLVQEGLRIVNRQPGSGTRVLFDAMLRSAGVEPAGLPGYEHTETTHLAVADAIARGHAEAGPGIYAAAASLGLHFIPLAMERYDLVIPAADWDRMEIQALVNAVRSERLGRSIEALGGYDTRETGREVWIQ